MLSYILLEFGVLIFDKTDRFANNWTILRFQRTSSTIKNSFGLNVDFVQQKLFLNYIGQLSFFVYLFSLFSLTSKV